MMLSESNCDLSIVIPVYNGQGTLLRCLDSVFSINWGALFFEVIVVDDSSTDKTMEILIDQASLHNNLVIIHLPINGKPGAARNRGIERSCGKFIMFLDADDILKPAIVSVLNYALGSGIDMCHFRFTAEYDIPEQVIPERVIMDGRVFAERFYALTRETGYFVSYLYSTCFLRETKHPFIEGRVHEDADWCEFHLWNCSTIAHIDSIGYKHFANSTSIMHSLSPQKDADNIMMCYRRLRFVESIENKDSHFKSSIIEHCKLWIKGVFSLRHMSRYNARSINSMYSHIDKEALLYLRKFEWSGYQSVCIHHAGLTRLIIAIIHPFASLIRHLN